MRILTLTISLLVTSAIFTVYSHEEPNEGACKNPECLHELNYEAKEEAIKAYKVILNGCIEDGFGAEFCLNMARQDVDAIIRKLFSEGRCDAH